LCLFAFFSLSPGCTTCCGVLDGRVNAHCLPAKVNLCAEGFFVACFTFFMAWGWFWVVKVYRPSLRWGPLVEGAPAAGRTPLPSRFRGRGAAGSYIMEDIWGRGFWPRQVCSEVCERIRHRTRVSTPGESLFCPPDKFCVVNRRPRVPRIALKTFTPPFQPPPHHPNPTAPRCDGPFSLFVARGSPLI